METVRERLQAVLSRIERACQAAGRSPGEVCLVAVSKRQPLEKLQEAYDAGQRDFGENYVQELDKKRGLLPSDVRWHQIGHVQTNKAKGAVLADLVHTVDSERLAKALAKAVADSGGSLPVLIEVSSGNESGKAGVPPEGAETLARAILAEKSLRLDGLMCIPPPGEGRPHFAALAALRARLEGVLGVRLPELSMGMSDDFEDAVAEGATLVRVGTAIFGERI